MQEQGFHLLRDKETELAAARSEIASAKIAAAKQEAELSELRTSARQLRQENIETHQALSRLRQELNPPQREIDIAHADVGTKVQAASLQEVIELKNSVSEMSQEIERLKQGMASAVAQLPVNASTNGRSAIFKKDDLRNGKKQRESYRQPTGDVEDKSQTARIHQTSYNVGEESRVHVTVKEGDTLSKLSRAFKVSPQEIRRANGISDSKLQVGQVLVIPISDSSEPRGDASGN